MPHELNFCKAMCLPKDLGDVNPKYKCYGIKDLIHYDSIVFTAMFKQATGLPHFVGAGRPVVYDEESGKARILFFKHLDTASKLDKLQASGYLIVAPDHIFDGSKYVKIVMQGLDTNLRNLGSRILNNKNEETGDEYTKVLIFANCGFGPVVSEDSDLDGVLRNEKGIAYGVRSEGKTLHNYVKIEGRGQNTAHLHVQVLALTEDLEHGDVLEKTLNQYCSVRNKGTLKQYRDKDLTPCVAVCQVNDLDQLERDLEFNIYSKPGTNDDSLSGIARDTIANHTLEMMGLKPDDHKKEYMALTAAYGRQIA